MEMDFQDYLVVIEPSRMYFDLMSQGEEISFQPKILFCMEMPCLDMERWSDIDWACCGLGGS
jgi:hypothetical protein